MKDKVVKLNYVPIIIACLFMIVQRGLTSAITVPTYDITPTRFYLYHVMNAVVLVGVNIFPLYLGFCAEKIKQKNAFKRLSSYFLMYVLVSIVTNVVFFILRNSLNIRDYWTIFFPISQNYFGYAVSCILALVCLVPLVSWLEGKTTQWIKAGLGLTSFLFVLLPTLFSKDIWAFQEGRNIVWVFYLVFLGYGLKRLGMVQKVRFPLIHLMLSLIILISTIFIMARVSLEMRADVSTAVRFCVPFSVFAMYYTLSLFLAIESRKKLRIEMSTAFIADTLIANQVTINLSLATYLTTTYYRKPHADSGSQWLKALIVFSAVMFVYSVIVAVGGFLLQKMKFYQSFERKLQIDSLEELKNKLLTCYKWLQGKKVIINTAVFFYVFTIIQMFLIADTKLDISVSDTVNAYAFILMKRQAPIMLNVLLIMLFFLLLYLLTNKFWYSFVFTLVIDLLMTISNYLKISMRQEPVLPADLKMLTGTKEILDMVNPIIIVIGILILVILTTMSFLLERRAKRLYNIKFKRKRRIISIFVILVFFSSLFFVNHKNSPSYLMFNFFRVNRYFYNQKLGAQINGPIVQFLNNIDTSIMEKPEDYTQENVEKVMAKYNKEALRINEERLDWAENETIIFNLSESFSDPKRVPNVTIDKDPIPYIRQSVKQNTGGLMLSNGYGGGTANMEWSSLTSLDISNLSPTLPTPYTQLVEKQTISPNITNLFDESIAIHPYVATLYNRINVFDKFGFDKFYYVDGPDELKYQDKIDDNIYISDLSAYNETLDKINDSLDKTQFIQLSTMQNHMPYKNYYKENNFTFSGTAVVEGRASELTTYMQGLYYTDEAVKYFIQELDKIEKPITFVFYGDHLPSIYTGNSMSRYGLAHHQTDYFIYSNRYSRERSKKLNKKIVSPYNFASLALEQANIKVTPFYALMTDVTNNVYSSTTDPSGSVSNNYNGQKIFVDDKNNVILEDQLTSKQKEILRDYRLIQYDLTAGEEYASEWAEQTLDK